MLQLMFLLRTFLIALLSILSACSYQPTGYSSEGVTISVPSIAEDTRGYLNDALVSALSSSGVFTCKQKQGQYLLSVSFDENKSERIGYRYDRNPVGELRSNLVGTENRRQVKVKVTVTDEYTQKVVFGPEGFTADIEYDYVDSDNLHDLSFINKEGKRIKVIEYSLGQLDTIEGAEDAASVELYHKLAQKIVDGMISQKW